MSLSKQVMKPEGTFTSTDATPCCAEKHSMCKAKGLKKPFKSNMIYCESYFDSCVEGEDQKNCFHEGCGITVTIKNGFVYFCLPCYRRLLERFAKKKPDTTICSSKWFGTCIGADDDRFIECCSPIVDTSSHSSYGCNLHSKCSINIDGLSYCQGCVRNIDPNCYFLSSDNDLRNDFDWMQHQNIEAFKKALALKSK